MSEPVFPFQINFPNEPGKGTMYHEGMTLRDYFAAKAMQEFVGVCDYKEGAIRAYKWADAMMEARK
jgi:hypothetical protein